MIATFHTSQHPEIADNYPHPITVTYPHFPFPPYTPLYPSHDHVQTYFRNFATCFGLYPYIRFNHSLESAYWVGNVSKGFWELSISTSGPQEEIEIPNEPSTCGAPSRPRVTRQFDHLVVANGHNHYPKLPTWAADDTANQWLRNGKGRKIIHSIYFREPEEFTGKVILVVGAGGSGMDIATQSSGHAMKVYSPLHAFRGWWTWLTPAPPRCIIHSLITESGFPHGRFPV